MKGRPRTGFKVRVNVSLDVTLAKWVDEKHLEFSLILSDAIRNRIKAEKKIADQLEADEYVAQLKREADAREEAKGILSAEPAEPSDDLDRSLHPIPPSAKGPE
jgi:hypothetical protein